MKLSSCPFTNSGSLRSSQATSLGKFMQQHGPTVAPAPRGPPPADNTPHTKLHQAVRAHLQPRGEDELVPV